MCRSRLSSSRRWVRSTGMCQILRARLSLDFHIFAGIGTIHSPTAHPQEKRKTSSLSIPRASVGSTLSRQTYWIARPCCLWNLIRPIFLCLIIPACTSILFSLATYVNRSNTNHYKKHSTTLALTPQAAPDGATRSAAGVTWETSWSGGPFTANESRAYA